MPIQWILILMLAGALVLTWRRERQGALGRIGALAWSVLWVGAAVLVFNPEVTSMFAKAVGVGRGTDAVTYVAIIFLFYLIFRIFLRLDRMDRDITTLVRRIGLDEMKEGVRKDGAPRD
jgi:hypothetical protein